MLCACDYHGSPLEDAHIKEDMNQEEQHARLISELQTSFFQFTRVFYPLLTSRDFIIPNPPGRENHITTISRGLVSCAKLQTKRLIITVPPGHGKSTLLSFWVAWCMARYPDSRFIYISYAHTLAAKHTDVIRRIMMLRDYRDLFGVELRTDSKAKDYFQTTAGGAVAAFGSSGAVTGCFAYDAIVYTNKGLLKIGDIVSKKLDVNVFSFNEKLAEIELKKVTNWFVNPPNDIIEINFSDMSSIRCTPNHKILTNNRGWVEARDLCGEDILFSPSYDSASTHAKHFSGFSLWNRNVMQYVELIMGKSFINSFIFFCFNNKILCTTIFDNISIDSKLFCKSSYRYRAICNQCKLFFIEFSIFDLSAMFRTIAIGNVSANSTIPNINYCAPANSILFGNFVRFDIRKAQFTYFKNFLFIKFVKVIHSSVFNSILNIFDASTITKIAKIIIQRVSIKMSNISIWRSISNKSKTNKRVNAFFDFLSIKSNSNHFITSSRHPWFQNFSRIKNTKAAFIDYGSIITSDNSFVGNAIKFTCSGYKSPVSISYINHEKQTYCIEVSDNHNFIVNGSCGATIVSNCDAGYPGLDRFSGALIIDDPIKPNDAFSPVIRENVIQNYKDTIQQRARGPNVPFIFIGQRVHEEDLGNYLLTGQDGNEWEKIVLKSLDDTRNPLYPEAWPLEKLLILEKYHPYEFSAQHQQNPIPAGGSLFKQDWFVTLDFEPEILTTFITADTAETNKSYNDATVFCFWGVYEIETMGRKTGEYGLHWLDCMEIRIEPKDLKDHFLDFWQDCMRHKVPPLLAAIEKKSTGTTLVSILQELRGIQIRGIERNRASGSKTQRFLQCQPYVASKRISFTEGAKHKEMCINHMIKLTANESHRHDDIGDCCADAIKIALIDKTLTYNTKQDAQKAATIMQSRKFALDAKKGFLYGSQTDGYR